MQLFYCLAIPEGENFLNQEESRHCVKALRKKSGDIIQITDGLGSFYECELTEVDHRKCSFSILSSTLNQKPDFFIHIAISPTKNLDRIEWFIEKAVEIGINEISFIQSSFSERKVVKLDRIRKKAISAMKQSVHAYLPKINEMVSLNSFLKDSNAEQKFVAHLENKDTKHLLSEAKPSKKYLVLIGPEGGFSEEEILMIKENDYKVAKIGNYRLRTETAGIVACSTLNDINYLE